MNDYHDHEDYRLRLDHYIRVYALVEIPSPYEWLMNQRWFNREVVYG